MARWYISTTAAACTAHFKQKLWTKDNEQTQRRNNRTADNTFFYVRFQKIAKRRQFRAWLG
jgi:hypothetical protein